MPSQEPSFLASILVDELGVPALYAELYIGQTTDIARRTLVAYAPEAFGEYHRTLWLPCDLAEYPRLIRPDIGGRGAARYVRLPPRLINDRAHRELVMRTLHQSMQMASIIVLRNLGLVGMVMTALDVHFGSTGRFRGRSSKALRKSGGTACAGKGGTSRKDSEPLVQDGSRRGYDRRLSKEPLPSSTEFKSIEEQEPGVGRR